MKNKDKKQKTKSPKSSIAWIPVVSILVAAILASVLIMQYNFYRNSHIVTFTDKDDRVIEKVRVGYGKNAVAPNPPEVENNMFESWDGTLLNVKEDSTAKPVYRNLSDEKNIFYLDSCYVNSGKTFSFDIKLGGEVDINSVTLGIAYDSEVLDYISCTSEDGLFKEDDVSNGDGYLRIPLKFSDSHAGKVATLTFKAHSAEPKVTTIPVDTFKPDTGTTIVSDMIECTSIEGKVYIY